MNEVLLDAPVRYWRCPSCRLTHRSQKPGVYTEFHDCPALGGINLPLQEVADPDDMPRARHVRVMREEYAGSAQPLSAIVTERPDGSQDCTVLAETASVIAE